MKYGKKLVLFTLFAMNLVDQPAPEVKIEQGILSGIVSDDGKILEYIGIPYATANVTNRFQAPLPPPKWDGVYKATKEYSCPQSIGTYAIIGTEDCLKVNVYVPAMAKKPLPVMVYIHGGAFFMGSGGKLMYGPKFLVKHDVILVTFNYRLGVLGFLCLGIKEAPGNAGLKDQVAALRWVKKNIAAFGGDPDNITLFGESAGGTSTALLIASPATEGLFNRAIVQSGSSVANWALNRNPVSIGTTLAKLLGHDTEDPYKLHGLFSEMDYKDLVGLKAERVLDLFFDSFLLHLPCIEKRIPGVEPVIDDLPFNLLNKKAKNIPIIYGSTSKEGLFLLADDTEKTLEDRNSLYVFASDLQFSNESEATQVNEEVKEMYYGKERISLTNKNYDIYTHLYFEMPAILESEIVLSNTKAPVYHYYFNYSGGRNFLKTRMGFANETGACHGDELLYLFTSPLWPYAIQEHDQKMINWMTTMWTNFAKYGEPTPPSAIDVPVKWTPSEKDDLSFLYIEDNLRMGKMPNPEPYKLWKDIYNKYRRKDLKYYH